MKHCLSSASGTLRGGGGFVTWTALLLFALGPVCLVGAGPALPGISEILRQVEVTTVPPQAYTAKVHQTVLKTNTEAAVKSLSLQSRSSEERDFVVDGTATGLIHASKASSRRQSTDNGTVAQAAERNRGATRGQTVSAEKSASLVMTMNPINGLRYMEKSGAGTISDGACNGSPCYELFAPYGRFAFHLWVTKDKPRVVRQLLLQDGKPLFDTQFGRVHAVEWGSCAGTCRHHTPGQRRAS